MGSGGKLGVSHGRVLTFHLAVLPGIVMESVENLRLLQEKSNFQKYFLGNAKETHFK